jgi:hypothetical protein
MKLYHGSNIRIDKIDLTKGKPNKDFGQGFYTTHIYEQAAYWSVRMASTRESGEAVVTEFEFDKEAAFASDLKIKVFDEPNKEWALFVMANRKKENVLPIHDYDIVIGPVANDRMATLFGLYELDIIDLDAVVKGLIYKNLNSQYFFHTERSLKYLHML